MVTYREHRQGDIKIGDVLNTCVWFKGVEEKLNSEASKASISEGFEV